VNSLRISTTLALCFHHFVDSFGKNTGGGGIWRFVFCSLGVSAAQPGGFFCVAIQDDLGVKINDTTPTTRQQAPSSSVGE
jgi:hypothetical protein